MELCPCDTSCFQKDATTKVKLILFEYNATKSYEENDVVQVTDVYRRKFKEVHLATTKASKCQVLIKIINQKSSSNY